MTQNRAIGSIAELYAHALAVEREAAARYAELAEFMSDHDNAPVAALFAQRRAVLPPGPGVEIPVRSSAPKAAKKAARKPPAKKKAAARKPAPKRKAAAGKARRSAPKRKPAARKARKPAAKSARKAAAKKTVVRRK